MPVVDQSRPVTTSEQQAVPVAQESRRLALIERIGTIADLACTTPLTGELGDVAYDRLRQAAAQLSSDRLHINRLTSLPCKSGEGAGEALREAAARVIGKHGAEHPWHWDADFDDGEDKTAERLRNDDRATADEVLALTPDATQTREAEGVHWRTDVEAAPRDGARILLMWHDHESLSPHVELGKMGCGGKGWCNTYGHAFTGEPTHWMQLPDAGSAVLNARGGA